MWDEAAAAAGFVPVTCADRDTLFGIECALRIIGGLAAANARFARHSYHRKLRFLDRRIHHNFRHDHFG
jgi:hypothetical protein